MKLLNVSVLSFLIHEMGMVPTSQGRWPDFEWAVSEMPGRQSDVVLRVTEAIALPPRQ